MAKKVKKGKKAAKKSAKVAEKRRKADVKRAKPKKGKKSMAGKHPDDDEGKKKLREIEQDDQKAAKDREADKNAPKSPNEPGKKPSGEESAAIIDPNDPMGQPPDTPENPLTKDYGEQGQDLSGSPGSAGEYIPVYSEAGTRGHPPDPTDPNNPNTPTDPNNPGHPRNRDQRQDQSQKKPTDKT